MVPASGPWEDVYSSFLLAHNATFDVGFLNFAAAKTGLTLPANPVSFVLPDELKFPANRAGRNTSWS